MDKITNIEIVNLERSWERISKHKSLARKAMEASRIDKEKKVKTREEVMAYNRDKARRSREKDANADRKNFASYLKQAHGLEAEDLARMYDRQGRKCACGWKIKLSMDYRILPGRIVCKSCAREIE